jgi:branched-subunit amino acid ABC-type transport system permease component
MASRIVVYAIAATALNLLLGYGGMVSLGHAAFFGLGAYVSGVLLSEGVLGAGTHLLATVALTGAGGAADRRDLAAHAGRVLHHDHAGLCADAVLPGQLDQGLWRRRRA